MQTISIILPVGAGAKGLRPTVRRLCRQARVLPFRAELIVVAPAEAARSLAGVESGSPFVDLRILSADGGTADADGGTADAVDAAAAGPTRIGVLGSTGDYVLVLDERASVPLGELSRLMPHFERGAHVAIGSRFLGPAARWGLPWRLRIGEALLSFLAGELLLKGIRHVTGGFTCYLGPVARQLYAMERAPSCAAELAALALAARLGYTLVEVPVHGPAPRQIPADGIGSALSFVVNLLRIRWQTGGVGRRLIEQST